MQQQSQDKPLCELSEDELLTQITDVTYERLTVAHDKETDAVLGDTLTLLFDELESRHVSL